MIKNIIKATEITEPKLKIAIIGDTGIGKSWLAASIASPENPVLDLDFDGRAASLAGKADVYVKTYVDKDFSSPTAMSELESDINEWEYEFSQNKLLFKTFVIDSASYMRMATEREIIRQQPTLSRGIKVGTKSLKIGQGYDVFNGNKMFTEHIISRLSQLGNLIVTFHERNEKDETKSTETKKVFTGFITVDPPHLSGLLSTFNDVWRLTASDVGAGDKRILITGLTNDFIGKTTFKGLAVQEEPDIKKLIAKHKEFISRNGNK
jgi:hypothetical protein